MAKIIAKASLVQNSNLFLHIADFGASDVTIVDDTGGVYTLTSTATIADWSASGSADVDGIIKRGLVAGDEVTLSHMGNAADEAKTATVDSITTNALTISNINGTTGTLTAGAAGTDINVVGTKKTYQFTEIGALSFIDGCQGIVLASKLVDMWDTLDLDKYSRPFTSIEPRAKSLASLNGWEPHDADTLAAIRDTALEIRTTATASASKIYALWRSGTLNEATDQFNFWPTTDAWDTAPTQAVMTGYINQLFLIYDVDGADNRGDWFTRCAEEGKTIIMEQHSVNYAEITPVSAANAIDPKLIATDVEIVANASGYYTNVKYNLETDGIYDGIVNSITYFFDGYVEGDSQTNEHVHEYINYLWRSTGNINNDGTGATLRGDKQWPMTSFSGDVFTVQAMLENYNSSQRNNLRVVDNAGAVQQWPSIMTLSVAAAALAVGGSFTVYHSNTYGTDAAVIMQNETPLDQQDIVIASNVDIVMAYSTYSVDGHTGGDPLPVTIAYNRPGFIEPDVVEVTLEGVNITATISPTADPSYIA